MRPGGSSVTFSGWVRHRPRSSSLPLGDSEASVRLGFGARIKLTAGLLNCLPEPSRVHGQGAVLQPSSLSDLADYTRRGVSWRN
jgi:hypothetical protein